MILPQSRLDRLVPQQQLEVAGQVEMPSVVFADGRALGKQPWLDSSLQDRLQSAE